MQIPISTITKKMQAVLKAKGYLEADTSFLIDMYLGGELRGHTSHGLASFPSFVKKGSATTEQPEVVKATEAFFLLDAHGNNGTLLGKQAADEAIARAKKQVVGFSMIRHMDSWLRPGAIAQYIAEQGFLGITVNSGGGAAVAPPGGYDPVAGTNPIAYAIPTVDGPLVVDMATSKRAWGQVRLANKYGTDLPPDTFYDNEGNVTLDPAKAWSVMSFGEYKGFSLALLFEVMCGSLIGMDMMVESTSGNEFGQKMPERGAFILVVDPEQTTGLDEFKKANSAYIRKIKNTRPRKGGHVRIPGEQAGQEQAAKLEAGMLDIPDKLWEEIKTL